MSFEEKDVRGADAAVERVLAGLRGTRVPEGLEQRVAVAVRARRAEEARGGVRGWVWAAAAVVAACVMVPVVWRSRRVEVAGVVSAPKVVVPQRIVVQRVEVAPKTVAARVVGRRKPMVRAVRLASAGDAVPAATRAVDALALEEARAPSRPAPPEALTAQERRLVQVAVCGTEEQRAALNPVVREQRYQEAKQAVLEFFEPPKQAEEVQE